MPSRYMFLLGITYFEYLNVFNFTFEDLHSESDFRQGLLIDNIVRIVSNITCLRKVFSNRLNLTPRLVNTRTLQFVFNVTISTCMLK